MKYSEDKANDIIEKSTLILKLLERIYYDDEDAAQKGLYVLQHALIRLGRACFPKESGYEYFLSTFIEIAKHEESGE